MTNRIHWLLALGIFLFVGTIPQNVLLGQDEQPSHTEKQPYHSDTKSDQAESQSAEPGHDHTQAAQPKTGLEQEGKLKSVDSDKMIFLIVDANDKEMLFHYDDQTKVVGQTAGVQGLTGQGDTLLRIQYRAEGENAIAEKIEMTERSPESDEAASPAPPEVQPQEEPGPPEAHPQEELGL